MNDINKYQKMLKDNVVITGGHFMINAGGKPELNKGTIDSFEIAAKLYKVAKEKKFKSRLGLLVNDIGTTCFKAVNACKTINVFSRNKFVLPKEYKTILKNNDIKISELELYWEKHARNRGKKTFTKFRHKSKIITEIGNNYYLLDKNGYGLILLTRKSTQDPSGTPACPLIMAGFNLEQEKRGHKNSINFYYRGDNNLINIPNYIVINKGTRLAKIFGSKISSENIYLI